MSVSRDSQSNSHSNSATPNLATAATMLPLARRIEEASLNAWPALHQLFLDGWILRFAKGFTKRANSIVPLYPSTGQQNLTEKIRYCENLYTAEHLQTVFRLISINEEVASSQEESQKESQEAPQEPSQHASLDQVLSERGYHLDETSLVLTKTLAPLLAPEPSTQTTSADLQILPLSEWLSVYCELTGMPEPARSLHEIILKSIATDCGFGALVVNGKPVACGLAVVEHELVGLFDIFTHEDQRGAGHGTQIVTALLAWAASQGAERAYLQMAEHNRAAATLYANLGFSEIYRYWYRIQA